MILRSWFEIKSKEQRRSWKSTKKSCGMKQLDVSSKVSYFKGYLQGKDVYTPFTGLNDLIMDWNRGSSDGCKVLTRKEKNQLKKFKLAYSESSQIVHGVHAYKLQPPTSYRYPCCF